QAIVRLLARRFTEGEDAGVVQDPVAGLEHRLARFDPAAEMSPLVEDEGGHATEIDALFARGLRVDDGLTVGRSLAEPEGAAGAADAGHAGVAFAEQLGLVALRPLLQQGGEGIVD